MHNMTALPEELRFNGFELAEPLEALQLQSSTPTSD
jgi:hypothetical protein